MGLMGVTLFAIGRSLIIGLDADEQYAVVLAYRIARGDLMIREIWDPHQTSAILPALMIKLFHIFRGNNTFLLLYLRAAGILLQGGVSFLWYCTMRKGYGRRAAFLTALVIFHTLPKWIVTPEFANQQLLFWILTILCLYRYNETRKMRYCAFAGIALCFTVLAYPSCVFLFLAYAVWLCRRDWKAALLLALTCFVGACIFVGYLFSYLTFADFRLYMEQIFADPSHSAGIGDKLTAYCGEAIGLSGWIMIYLAIGLSISHIFCKCVHGKGSQKRGLCVTGIFLFALCVAVADQVRLWIFGLVPHVHPQLHYLLLYVFGGFLYYGASREKKFHWEGLYELAWLPSLVGFGAVLLLTNLDLKASFVHLLPGMLATLLFWCDSKNRQEDSAADAAAQPMKHFRYKLLLPVIWVVILIGARGFLIRADEGQPANIFVVKQKALYGAAKNIYCSYMTGYQYNSDTLFIEENLLSGTKILYIGSSLLFVYLMNDMEVCTPTVISTPIYDKRYIEYYELNPNKLPEAIIIDKEYFQGIGEKNLPISEWIQTEYDWESRAESEFLWILEQR